MANMVDGFDIYDLESKAKIHNIRYDIGEYRYVDLSFVDEDTVVIGHPLGSIIVGTFAPISQRVYPVTVLKTEDCK